MEWVQRGLNLFHKPVPKILAILTLILILFGLFLMVR